MTAIERLNKLAAEVAAEETKIRKEYRTMAQALALMTARGCRTINDAFYAEAKARVFARA